MQKERAKSFSLKWKSFSLKWRIVIILLKRDGSVDRIPINRNVVKDKNYFQSCSIYTNLILNEALGNNDLAKFIYNVVLKVQVIMDRNN